MSEPDRLQPDRIKAALGPVTIGREIIVVEQAESTNDEIAELAKNDPFPGVVVVAEHQTAGRGQRGNTWISSAYKALTLSVLLRPNIALKDSGRLTTWAVNTVASTIADRYRLNSTVKPPNDVYIAGRKVAGVLVEMKAQSGGPHLAILGIGINVNQTPADFPAELRDRATSLAISTGHAQDRNQLAIELLRNLDQTYRAQSWPAAVI
jgi:BirA family biotin operon repressor/biotin-[acetyl-CoA-carboxylase] ligase